MEINLSGLAVTGRIWHMDPENVYESLLDGEDGRIVVERTDKDEVAVHFMLPGDDQAVSSIYTNVAGANALMGLLHIAVNSGALAPPSSQQPKETT